VKSILETQRLLLRELLPDDAESLAHILSDPETMRFYPAPYDRQGVNDWIDRNRRRYAEYGVSLWALLLRTSGELVGDCGIIPQQVDGELLYEIGYHLRRDFWHQGLATEAAIACRNWGFAHLPVDRMISLIRPANVPSRRVAERNGMTIWKEVEWRGFPHIVYSITREETERLMASPPPSSQASR
jgi:RimJ/RimL family protein N-acetyltransferase